MVVELSLGALDLDLLTDGEEGEVSRDVSLFVRLDD